MRDSEKRERQFVVRGKKEYDYDSPAVRRRKTLREREEEEERLDMEERLLRERGGKRARDGEEEEEEARPTRRGRRSSSAEEEFYEEDYDEGGTKAPKIVRIFAWIALMVILFACGYLATNYFFSWSDRKGGERIGNVYGAGSEVKEAEKAGTVSASNEKYTLYLPENGSLSRREVEINGAGTQEEIISKVLSIYIDSLKEKKILDTSVSTFDIFQGGDWLYMDMTPSFQSSLKALGRQKAELLLCGFVKTVQENFPPLKKIKFYVNSKEIKDQNPVDLSQPWERTE
ncbi:MAG: hypothetical protein SOR75_09250 [Synergistes jonesii]|uniref:hypothetical protein n=1 Tax=Synergistes jonesii TaxID=2754 RepID=UPI002A752324|nr:hypothetical protein [Synergistes jonesii]MDY2985502.1 hypothetical protein [Synergistes jonesii]